MPLSAFHPLIQRWFHQRVGTPTLPQARGWPAIAAGHHTLISAPTGSGKTLAAFLYSIDVLFRDALSGGLRDCTSVIYVSPLKALSSDVRKNLQQPLLELEQAAQQAGLLMPPLRVGLRTGDTSAQERQAMIRRPPHILITTPESLYLCLTAVRMRQNLRAVRTVIVDEVHALLPDKRGAHLTLSLERLDELCKEANAAPPQRIGLSATVHPIEEVGHFLAGTGRACQIISGHDSGPRALDLQIGLPQEPLGSICSTEQWQDIHDQVAKLIGEHKSTLIFVSTRRLCERVAHSLAERLGPEAVMAHHGSLSRGMRLRVEERLKNGTLKAVVATASLELGIDIGAIDLVCQIGSPRAISTFLQRVGRANHRPAPDAVPRARLFALTINELVECAALVRAAHSGLLDRQVGPHEPLDVLAQQLVATCASQEQDEQALLALCQRAWPFRNLSAESYSTVLALLAEGVATRRGRPSAHLHRDRVNGKLKGRRGARIFAAQNGGTIPEPNDFEVVVEGDEVVVGRLDEEFVTESSPGDIFLLGSNAWRLRRISGNRAYVSDAAGQAPTVPFWAGESPGRTFELSQAVSQLRSELEDHFRATAPDEPWLSKLTQECGMPAAAAAQILSYLRSGYLALGRLPTQKALVAERFFDEGGGMQLILHMPFGARQNRAFGLALRKRFCRAFNFELQAAATDDGVLLSLGETHSFPLETVWEYLKSANVRHILTQAVLGAPIFAPHFRHVATRALTIPRRRGGKKLPPPIVRVITEDLLGAVFPHAAACPENLPGGDIDIPDHPLVHETLRECLETVMDVDGLTKLLLEIEAGQIQVYAADTTEASPLSHHLIHAAPYAFLDDTPAEERRTRAVITRRTDETTVLPISGAQGLSLPAVEAVRAQSWPRMRDLDELHDALLTLHFLPASAQSATAPVAELRFDEEHGAVLPAVLAELLAARRATILRTGSLTALVASERAARLRTLFLALHAEDATTYPAPKFQPEPPFLAESQLNLQEAGADEMVLIEVVRGYLSVTGPWATRDLAARLHLPAARVLAALLFVESEGMALRGHFLPGPAPTADNPQFCDRRLLARIHRLTQRQLRSEIVPATSAELWQFLARWQHLWPGTQLFGPAGLLRVLEQLQGFITSAGAWEESLLRQRLRDYSPTWLDGLCLSGEVAWGRLRPQSGAGLSTSTMTRATPISLWLRQSANWLVPPRPSLHSEDVANSAQGGSLSATAEMVREYLERRGASFLGQMALDLGQPVQDVLDALSELCAAGLVTADGAAGLRLLLAHVQIRGRSDMAAALGAGRWALLFGSVAAAGGAARWRGAEAVLGAEADWENPALLESWAEQYLKRYGVLCRELLLREPCGPPLHILMRLLRRMEARGLLRSGYFVSGLSGEQFATPEALEGLKLVQRLRKQPSAAAGVEVAISAADPLNLTGVLFAGPRISATASAPIVFRDGTPLLSTAADAPPSFARSAGQR